MANTAAKVLAVDTAQAWVSHVRNVNQENPKLDAIWVDVGPVGNWGRPISYEKRGAFEEYVEALWSREEKPDVVLVNGRFRVASFLTCLIRAEPGTKIIFDDYTNRPIYHVVEEFAERQETCGRQCLFHVPPMLTLRRH